MSISIVRIYGFGSLDRVIDTPAGSRVLCVWFPRESHRYSRRFPEFYVFGSLERVIDTPAGFPSFMCLPMVGQWSTGSPSPSIYRTAPTGLPVLIQTWVTLSLAVFPCTIYGKFLGIFRVLKLGYLESVTGTPAAYAQFPRSLSLSEPCR